MRYLVIGANGQLGRDLCPRLPGKVIGVGREQADLTRSDRLQATVAQIQPQVIVNCAAYNFVDRAESEPDLAFAVNALGVQSLARLCGERQITLVHFSSDYVFGLDAGRSTPWNEDDPPGPVSVYGASKLAGEYFVRTYCPKHFVIRTCGLYGVWGSGGKGGNFVETMLKLAAQGKPLRIVDDQVCTPTYTRDLANAVVPLIDSGRFGLYHLTSAGSCTWFEFASAIFDLAALKVERSPVTSVEYGAAARRPAYSVLSNRRYESLGFAPMRPWREALATYLTERLKK